MFLLPLRISHLAILKIISKLHKQQARAKTSQSLNFSTLSSVKHCGSPTGAAVEQPSTYNTMTLVGAQLQAGSNINMQMT